MAGTVTAALLVGEVLGSGFGPAPPPGSLVVGIPDRASLDGLPAAALAASTTTPTRMRGRGHQVRRVALGPFLATGELLYGSALLAERTAAVGHLLASASDGVVDDVRRAVERGSSYSAIDHVHALARLEDRRREVAPTWDRIDVLLVPSVPEVPTVAAARADPDGTNHRLGRHTTFANLLGLAAVTVPRGRRADGTPASATRAGAGRAGRGSRPSGRRPRPSGRPRPLSSDGYRRPHGAAGRGLRGHGRRQRHRCRTRPALRRRGRGRRGRRRPRRRQCRRGGGRARRPRVAVAGDVAREELHQQVVATAEERFGPVDVYCSNAGTGALGGIDAPLEAWQTVWEVNTLAHVLAARAVLPSMLERGRGHLVQTASAAGLLTNLGDAAVHGHQARRRRPRRVARRHLRPPRHPGVLPVSHGRRHRPAASGQRGRGRRRGHGGRRGARAPTSSPATWSTPWPTSASWCSPTPRWPGSSRARSPTPTPGSPP